MRSRDTARLYKELTRGFDRNTTIIQNWLSTNEASEFLKLGNGKPDGKYERLQEFFNNCSAYEDLMNTDLTEERFEDIIKKVYKTAQMVSYAKLKVDRVFTVRDKYQVEALQEYGFDLISKVNADQVNNISNILIEGAISQRSPRELGTDILKATDMAGVTNLTPRQRAVMIARTETKRAKETANVQALDNYGVNSFSLNPIDGACELCMDLADDNPYKYDEAIDLVPVHPNCYCTIGIDWDNVDYSDLDIQYEVVDET